jgi:hypothetical protein
MPEKRDFFLAIIYYYLKSNKNPFFGGWALGWALVRWAKIAQNRPKMGTLQKTTSK